MALRYYQHRITGDVQAALHVLDSDEWEELLVPPSTKLMTPANPYMGKSKERNMAGILKARARNHSREVDLDDNIQINKANGLDSAVAQNFLNPKGQRRSKLDDL